MAERTGGASRNHKESALTSSGIESELINNPDVVLVGHLHLIQPAEFNRFTAIHDFFVEPSVPPVFDELTPEEVSLLEESAWNHSLLTEDLLRIPGQFADGYNHILESIFPVKDFDGVDYTFKPFRFTTGLRSARVQFGYRTFKNPQPVGESSVTRRTEITVPELADQAASLGLDSATSDSGPIAGDIRIRLFPQGLGERVYRYEKGFYLDGDVKDWKEPVWNGRYISVDAATPAQLAALAQGQFPYPDVEYLDTSDFDGDPEEATKLRTDRLRMRSAQQHTQAFAEIIR